MNGLAGRLNQQEENSTGVCCWNSTSELFVFRRGKRNNLSEQRVFMKVPVILSLFLLGSWVVIRETLKRKIKAHTLQEARFVPW